MGDLSYISKKTKSGFLILGAYQILGGMTGIILAGLHAYSHNRGMILFLLLAFLFFGYSILCGVLLIKTNVMALRLSLVNFLLQLVGWTILGFGFEYISGAFISVGIELTGPAKFDVTFGLSNFHLTFNRNPEKFVIGFNLIALYLLFYTDRLSRKVKSEKETQELF
jgi:hypothetical protein